MRELPVVTDLPMSVFREIGRVVVYHAFLEYAMSRPAYDLLNINPKQGRVAVREPRGHEIFDMVKDLAFIDGIELHKNYQLLQDSLEACKKQRDQLAHGIWLRDPKTDQLFLRLLGGSWQPDPKMRGKIRRRINPQGAEYGLPEIRSTLEMIQAAIDVAIGFHSDITGLLKSLRAKRARRARRRNLRQLSFRAKRKPPLKS